MWCSTVKNNFISVEQTPQQQSLENKLSQSGYYKCTFTARVTDFILPEHTTLYYVYSSLKAIKTTIVPVFLKILWG